MNRKMEKDWVIFELILDNKKIEKKTIQSLLSIRQASVKKCTICIRNQLGRLAGFSVQNIYPRIFCQMS